MSIESSRRWFLENAGLGFGGLAASCLLEREARGEVANPLAPKRPPLAATARSVIFLFMHGGPSHIDTFDPKPQLVKLNGKLPPESFGNVQLQFSKFREAPLLASRRTFQKHGQAGMDVSDLFPEVSKHADSLAVVRSMHHDGFTHTAALNWLNNGWPRLGRPSVGSWAVYGLGSESDNLPAFVVMLEGGIKSGSTVWSSGFLPAMYQGTTVRGSGTAILNARRPSEVPETEQRDMLDAVRWFNERHLASRSDDTELAARISAYELAFRMQAAVPELSDLSKESVATRTLYGIDQETTRDFGSRCLMARRLVERGVRFVQLWSGTTGGGGDWDGHAGCDRNHLRMASKTDRPIAGLLADLKSRGLLDSTLIVWGGEFGRTPTSDGSANGGGDSEGRDHNPYGFTVWLAGGGVKGGKVIGTTDEIGLRVTSEPVHVHDLHATILRFMGLDHEKLVYSFQGRDFRLTDVHGNTDLHGKLTRA